MKNPIHENNISRYPQPLDGGTGHSIGQLPDCAEEVVDYLPGTSCRIWYTHLSIYYPEHWHNTLEIIMGESGTYTVEAKGSTYEVHSRDIMLIPPCITHSLHPQEGCSGFVYLLDIGVLSAIKSAAATVATLTEPLFITEKNNPMLYVTTVSLLSQMQKEYFSNNNMRELLIYSHILTLIAEIGRNYFDLAQDGLHSRPDKRKECMDKFNEILYFINKHYMDDLTISQLAKQFGFSKYYFVRLFKQYTKFTFCDYLTNQRIKAAEYLLSQPDMSITDIAYQVGFSSISTFSRVFRQRKNCSPSEFRKIYVQNYSGHTGMNIL